MKSFGKNIILCFLIFSINSYFTIYPSCSIDSPLFLKKIEIHIHSSSNIKNIQAFFYSDNSTQNVSVKTPFVSIPDIVGKKGHRYNDTGYKYEICRLRFYDIDERMVDESEQIIYWDYRFNNIQFTFEFVDVGPGEVVVNPISNNEELEKMISYVCYYQQYDGGFDHHYQGTKSLRMIFNYPGAYLFKFYAYTGHSPLNGYSKGPVWFRIQVCSDITGCPYADNQTYPFHRTINLSGEFQVPLWHKNIAIYNNISIQMPLKMKELSSSQLPKSITFDLPEGLEILDNNVYTSNYHMERNETRVTIVKDAGSYTYRNKFIQLLFKFDKSKLNIDEEYEVFVRMEDIGDYQKIVLVPKKFKEVTKPKLLKCSFAYMDIKYFGNSFEAYNRIGFNEIGKTGGFSSYYVSFDDGLLQYKYENWNQEYPLIFTYGLFHMSNFNFINYTVYSIFNDILKTHHVHEDYFPDDMDEQTKQKELELWTNAVEFYNNTGKVDLAYNGYFIEVALRFYHETIEYIKPSSVNIDCEGYSDFEYYVSVAGESYSKNFENRRYPSETDEELVTRIGEELLGNITKGVYDVSQDIDIIFYGMRADNNVGYKMCKYSSFSKFGIIPQPSIYKVQKSMEVTANLIRHNKLNSETIIPIPSPGTYGDYDPKLLYETCLHIFENGASGINFYGTESINNGWWFFYYEKCMKVIVPYEHVIYHGKLCYYDIDVVSDNLIISCMKLEDEYLITISKPDFYVESNLNGVFKLDYEYSKFKVVDVTKRLDEDELYNNVYEYEKKEDHIEFSIVMENDDSYSPMVLHIIQKKKDNSSNDLLVIVIISIISASLLLFLSIVLIFIIIIFFIKKKKDSKLPENDEMMVELQNIKNTY